MKQATAKALQMIEGSCMTEALLTIPVGDKLYSVLLIKDNGVWKVAIINEV